MKKRMLALLLTLCMVVSLLPAQLVVAEGETANVTILGNGSQFVLKKGGEVVNPLSYQAVVSIPLGSTLSQEGYTIEEWDRDTQYLVGWSADGAELPAGQDVLSYVVNSDVTFEAGWIGVGGDTEPDVTSPTMTIVAEGAQFIVYPVQGDAWSTDYYGVPVAEGETLRDYMTDISTPTHQYEPTKKFDGWMVCTQDASTGVYVPVPDTGILGLSEILDYPVSSNHTTYFVAQWRVEEPAPIDLGTIALDTPVTVQIDYFPGQTTQAAATFTPGETGYYTIYQTYSVDGSYYWQDIAAFLNDVETPKEEWFATVDESTNANGFRWYFEGGNTYQLVFSGTTGSDSITYTMKKAVAPTAITFPYGDFEGVVGSGSDAYVSFEPFYAYADVTYSITDTTVADFNDWGGIDYLKVGSTTITAVYGELTATAQINISAPVTLQLGTAATGTTSGSRMKCLFTPADSGEYTFDFTSESNIHVSINDSDDNHITHWNVNAGGRRTAVVSLTGGEEYVLWLEAEEATVAVTAKVTAGSDILTLTEGTLLAVELPAKSSVTAAFEAPQGDWIEYVAYWPAEEALKSLEIEMLQVQNGGYGYFGNNGHQNTLTTYGRTYDLMGDYTYHVVLTNPTDAAMEFDFTLQQPVEDTEIAFEGTIPKAGCVGDGRSFRVLPVHPAGVLGNLTWDNSDPDVVTLNYSVDHPQYADVTFVGEGTATITATNAYNNESVSITFTVFASGTEPNLHFDGNNGEFTVTTQEQFGEQSWETNAYGVLAAPGESMGDHVISISDPVFWDPTRVFENWMACTNEELYDEEGNMYGTDFVQIEGTKLMTTAEALAYPAREDGKAVSLIAQWAGDDADYYSDVGFEVYGGELTVVERNDGSIVVTPAPGGGCKEDGGTIADHMWFTIPNDPTHAEYTFEGWLQYNEEERTLVSETILQTKDVFELVIPEYNVRFVAKWDGIDMDVYRNFYGDSEGPGGGQAPGFEIPEGATVTNMVKDTKYDVAAETAAYFKFTAPADGAYQLCTDAQQGIGSEMMLSMDNWSQPFFDGRALTFEMTKDETIQFMATATQAAKVWVEDVNEVVKLELVSQDKTATYIVNDYFDPEGTLHDVVLKATFEDGTVIQGSGFEVYQKIRWDMPIHGFVEKDSDAAAVVWESGSAKVSYPVAVDKATVTGFEVIPAADMFNIYEGTMGTDYDGIYVYEEAFGYAYTFATYQFTWSDGTVETFQMDMDSGNQYYHGIYVGVGAFDPFTNPWKAGTNLLPICYGDLTDDLPVTIKENNIKSIKLLSLGVDQYTLGDPDFFEKSGSGWVMNSYDISEYELQVNYVDGTSKILTEEDETDFRGMFALLDNTIVGGDIEQKVHTAPGKNKVYMILADQIAEYEVSIVEQAVVDGNASVSETTVEEALEEVKDGTVTLDVSTDTAAGTGEEVTTVKLPVASVENLLEEEVKQVEVKLDSATVTLDAKTLEAIADQAEGATITMAIVPVKTEELTDKQQAALKDKDVDVVLSALILSDGEPIGDFKGGSVKVQIPFTPESGYVYKVAYVADDGTMTIMTTEVGADHLTFWTGHFSDYVVTKEKEEPKPTEPTDPEETTKPTEPAVPEETTKPTEPAVPEETTKPTEPSETTKPTEATKPSNPSVPDTGDNSGVTGMMLMMLASGTMAAVLWLSLRKRRAV